MTYRPFWEQSIAGARRVASCRFTAFEPGDVAGDDVAQVVAALAERVAVLEAQVAQILARLPDVKPWQRPR